MSGIFTNPDALACHLVGAQSREEVLEVLPAWTNGTPLEQQVLDSWEGIRAAAVARDESIAREPWTTVKCNAAFWDDTMGIVASVIAEAKKARQRPAPPA